MQAGDLPPVRAVELGAVALEVLRRVGMTLAAQDRGKLRRLLPVAMRVIGS
jgi:hypothetical protein